MFCLHSQPLISIFHYFPCSVSGLFCISTHSNTFCNIKRVFLYFSVPQRELYQAWLFVPIGRASDPLRQWLWEDIFFGKWVLEMLVPFVCRQESFSSRMNNDRACSVTLLRWIVLCHLIEFAFFSRGCSQNLSQQCTSGSPGLFISITAFLFGTQTLQLPGFLTEGSAMLIKALIVIVPYSCKAAAVSVFTFNVWKTQPATPAPSWEWWRGDNRHLMVEADSVYEHHHITST